MEHEGYGIGRSRLRDGLTAAGVAVLAAIVLFMLAGAIPAEGNRQAAVFRTPVFVLLLGLLCLVLLACCLTRRPSLRSIPFLLTHLGIVTILAGAFLGYLREEKSRTAFPVGERHAVKELPLPDGGRLDLGFELALLSFDVVRRDPGEHVPRRPGIVTDYRAVLRVRDDDGTTVERTMGVNRPVDHGGWRFYLMDYDRESSEYVVMLARRDPGRRIAAAGMHATMIGIALMCFSKSGGGRNGP